MNTIEIQTLEERIEKFLNTRMSYKPGWQFYVDIHEGTLNTTIRIKVALSDVTKDDKAVNMFRTQIEIDKLDILIFDSDPRPVIRAVRELIIWIEMHEVDEWLRVDGKFVNDPHPELRNDATIDLDGIIYKGEAA